jgi:hypothetical protein
MEALEKKILKTACENLKDAKSRPNISTIEGFESYIRKLVKGIDDTIALIKTLMDEEEPKQGGGITLG